MSMPTNRYVFKMVFLICKLLFRFAGSSMINIVVIIVDHHSFSNLNYFNFVKKISVSCFLKMGSAI